MNVDLRAEIDRLQKSLPIYDRAIHSASEVDRAEFAKHREGDRRILGDLMRQAVYGRTTQ
jgi:hypothetical protein